MLAGALIGTGIGRAVVRMDQGRRLGTRAEIRFAPVLAPGFRGLSVMAKF
jgi:hypothetical protein